MSHSRWIAVLLLVGVSGLGACSSAGVDAPVDRVPDDVPVEAGAVDGQATVDSIEVVQVESFPVGVQVIVRGLLPDGCTQLGDSVVRLTGSAFEVTLPTIRMAGAECSEAPIAYEMPVPLDSVGLPAGAYTVAVHGVTDTFTLDVDNWLSSDSVVGCPDGGAGQLPYANEAAGYCLLYPEGFIATEYPTGLIVENAPKGFPHPSLPILQLEVSDAADQTAEDAADGLAADLFGFEITRSDIVLGGLQAVVLDGLPGQDSNRQVLVVRNGQLYKLVFSYSEPGPDLDHLYDVIVNSFTFLPAD